MTPSAFHALTRDSWFSGTPSLMLFLKFCFAVSLDFNLPAASPPSTNKSKTLEMKGLWRGVRSAIASTSSRYLKWRRTRRWYSVAGIDLNSSGSSTKLGRWIDVVCDEAIFISSVNPNLQAIAYALRGSVFANPTNDARNRTRATSTSYLSARTKASDKAAKSSTTGEVGEG